MKRWWTRVVKDYFTFTKKERTGIFVLVFIGALFYLAPKFIKPAKDPVDKDAFAKELANLKITVDSSRQFKNYRNDDDNDYDHFRPKSYDNEKAPKGELFTFDPNTLDASGWKRLGVRDKTVHTIQNFRAKGFKFRKPEDIKRVYGLREDEANRLIPYIRIGETPSPAEGSAPNISAATPTIANKPVYKPRIVEINSADTSALISLPGIGSKLAARIVAFRDKLGGFTNVQQLAETYGVPDSTFQKIKPLLQVSPANIKTYNINSPDANELKNHPYIKWNIANAIVNYRKQHGNYKSVDDLKKIDIIPKEVFQKIAPYLKTM